METARQAGSLPEERGMRRVHLASAGHADTAQRVDTPLEQAPGIQTAQI
jgi:hypothetical protein